MNASLAAAYAPLAPLHAIATKPTGRNHTARSKCLIWINVDEAKAATNYQWRGSAGVSLAEAAPAERKRYDWSCLSPSAGCRRRVPWFSITVAADIPAEAAD
jgi:hypothetical protein